MRMLRFTLWFALLASALGLSAASIFASTESDPAAPQPGCVPHFENGQPAGYDCNTDALHNDGSLYQKLELKNGDVIHSVNGDQVTDPEHAFELMNQMKAAREPARQAVEAENMPDVQEARPGLPYVE